MQLSYTHPIGIVVDVNIKVLIHGGEGSAVLQVLGGQTFVDHVVVKRIKELDVDIAHQGI